MARFAVLLGQVVETNCSLSFASYLNHRGTMPLLYVKAM
jgi:hypothetical protein